MKRLFLIAALLLLTGCVSSSSYQQAYDECMIRPSLYDRTHDRPEARDVKDWECRVYAEDHSGLFPTPRPVFQPVVVVTP